MKLTQRQLDKIAGLIDEEAKVRNELHESMYSNRKNSVLNESLMFEDYSFEDMPKQFTQDLEDAAYDYAMDEITKINKLVYENLARFMKSFGSDMKAVVWEDELEESFNTYELSMELAIDIREAILKYASGVAGAAAEYVGATSEKKNEEEIEPRYSEYE